MVVDCVGGSVGWGFLSLNKASQGVCSGEQVLACDTADWLGRAEEEVVCVCKGRSSGKVISITHKQGPERWKCGEE